MKIISNAFLDEGLKDLFKVEENVSKINFGTVVIQPGEKIPREGFSKHLQDEYSIIVDGEIEGESNGEAYKVSGGNATLIPANEEHWTINKGNQPCKIVFALVEKE